MRLMIFLEWSYRLRLNLRELFVLQESTREPLILSTAIDVLSIYTVICSKWSSRSTDRLGRISFTKNRGLADTCGQQSQNTDKHLHNRNPRKRWIINFQPRLFCIKVYKSYQLQGALLPWPPPGLCPWTSPHWGLHARPPYRLTLHVLAVVPLLHYIHTWGINTISK